MLTGEQSNTSLVFGESAIFKVFRRVAPGPNPDLEVAAALAELGSTHVAEPYGWVETRIDGATTVLAILSRYLRAASDGWSLAATSVRDLYALALGTAGPVGLGTAAEAGGDFAGEAERLGVATAQVHADLAEAFGTSELEPEAIRELAEQMFRRLDMAIAAVPELARYADKIGDAFSSLAKLTDPVPAQRVHGDYHLGQVMRTQTGWVVLDFEGEPASPLAQRRARSSPLRDVAGMLRSFDYAARHQLLAHPERDILAPVAGDWVQRNGEAFCAGYAAAGGLDPARNAVLLRALLLDKAVYEVIYEARNRPNWLVIPLESIADAVRLIAMTDTEVSLGEIERLVSGQHHDPHSILGAHPGPDGIVVRALRPLARSVTLITDDGRRLPMTHLHQGVFTVTLPDEKVPDYRIATSYSPEGDDETVADDPYRYLPLLGEFDLYLIGEGRHEELWRVLGSHVREVGPADAPSPGRPSPSGPRTPAGSASPATSTTGTAARSRCARWAPRACGSCSSPA